MEKWTLQGIGAALSIHIAQDAEKGQKIDDMYKIIVTGNGVPALPEIVRNHEGWINGQKEEIKNKKTAKREYQRSIIMLIIGQIFTLLTASAAIVLGLQK